MNIDVTSKEVKALCEAGLGGKHGEPGKTKYGEETSSSAST
jgi:hypothetical protein